MDVGTVSHIKHDGEWVEVGLFDVFDMEDNLVGQMYAPIDKDWLDIIDDPLTIFASDNGLNVDELYSDYY